MGWDGVTTITNVSSIFRLCFFFLYLSMERQGQGLISGEAKEEKLG